MAAKPPSALHHLESIRESLRGRVPAVFLDYDGTLTPIVARPEAAALDGRVRECLARLARLCPVAVMSGRDLVDLRTRVGLPQLYYAGCHGFEIEGPGWRYEHPPGVAVLPTLEAAAAELAELLAGIAGVRVERKRFAIAVHFREMDEADLSALGRAVDRVSGRHPTLRMRQGKKIVESLPDVPWHKGAALGWLLARLGLDRSEAMPICLGDDVTDEDAFEAVATGGLGIVVLDAPRPTTAHYRLVGPEEVHRFLETLTGWIEDGR
jgi:trehalose-phosphatase